MHPHNLRHSVPRIFAGAVAVGAAAAAVVVFAVAVANGGPLEGASHAATKRARALQPLASTAAATSPTPVPLSPQQADCVTKFYHSVASFRRFSPGQQLRILQGLQVDCVDRELGIVPSPPPRAEQAQARAPVIAPSAGGRPAGAGYIRDGIHGGPSVGGLYRYSNVWGEQTPSGSIAVWAGNANVQNPQTGVWDFSQGVVAVVGFDISGQTFYPTPSRHGELTAVGAVGQVVELKAEDGTMFYFDVASRKYVPSLPAVATPPPGSGGHRGRQGAIAATAAP